MRKSGAPESAFGVEHLPLLTAAEMRAWDSDAQEEHGIPERVLMEVAGRAAARVVHRLYPRGRVVAAVGRGNNGGDALVLLRSLQAWGREVMAVLIEGADLPSHLLHGWQIEIASADEAEAAFPHAAVLVDGILGTGARGEPRPPQARMIGAMNASSRPIVALDGPSGVDLSTGSAPGAAIQAAVTVTFGAPKRGLVLFPGRSHAGRIVAVEVGFPPLQPSQFGAVLVTSCLARARLPAIPPNAHKGDLGTVAVVAGEPGVAGAAVLVGMGAARMGAGKIFFLSAAENREILQASVPEALFMERGKKQGRDLLQNADAIVAGPGMGTDQTAHDFLEFILRETTAPLLVDADALTLLAGEPALLPVGGTRPMLLTPHPGEMSRLIGREVKDIVGDPFQAADEVAQRFGCTVLLKGAPSLVSTPGEPTLVNTAGHSGIATGGMGDTLAGVAGALLAVGAPPREAAALALFFSGRAAEIAGRGRSLLPRDVAAALPAALLEPGTESDLGLPDVCLDLPPAY